MYMMMKEFMNFMKKETLIDQIWVTEKDKPFLFPTNKSLDSIKKSKKFKEIVKAVINY